MAARARTRRGPKLGGDKEQDRKDKFKNLGLPCFYSEPPLKENYIEKLIRANEECRQYTPDTFCILPQRANQLCFLYHQRKAKDDLKSARKLNAEVLEAYPDNVISLGIKFNLSLNEKNIPEMDKVLAQLEHIKNYEREKLIAKAELAFFYSHLYPHTYRKAVNLYSEVLHIQPDDKDTPEEDQKVLDELLDPALQLIYRLELAQTYNKLMNQDNVRLAEENHIVAEEYIKHCYDCIFVLLNRVIRDAGTLLQNGELSSSFPNITLDTVRHILGKAWVEFGLACKKYQTSGIKGQDFIQELPPELSREETLDLNGQIDIWVHQCYTKGYEIGPDNIDLLENYAIQLRTIACDEKGLQEALEVFDKVLKINPNRHKTLHHKALCLKEVWYEMENMKEKIIKNNDQRRERNSLLQKGSTYSKVLHDLKHSPQFPGCNQKTKRNKKGKKPRSEPSTPYTQQAAPDFKRSVSIPTTKPPRRHTEKLPGHRKEPGFFDKLHVSNPRDPNPSKPHKCLVEAKACLEKAVESTKQTSPRYMIDLARVLICLGKDEEALQYFEMASNEDTKINNKDAAYLFEQWALLKHERYKNCKSPQADLEHIKDLFRTAVHSAVKARERSKMAYYKLCDITEEQLKETGLGEDEQNRLNEELGLLYATIEKIDKAKCAFLELLKQDHNKVEVMWHLVETFNDSGNFAAAFGYIETICEHLKSTDEMSNLSDNHLQLIFNAALNKVDKEERPATKKSTLQTLFGLLTYKESTKQRDRIALVAEDHRKIKDSDIASSDVVVIAPEYDGPMSTLLRQALQETCGLEVFWLTPDGHPNSSVPEEISLFTTAEFAVKKTKSLILVPDPPGTEQNPNIIPVNEIIEMILAMPEVVCDVRVSVVKDNDVEEECLPPVVRKYAKVSVNADEVMVQNGEAPQQDSMTFVEELLEKMLLEKD